MQLRLLPVFIILFILSSCVQDVDIHTDAAVFRYNESKGITSLDPAFARNQTNIWPVSQLFNGLVQLNDSLIVEPCIARSWEISDDGLSYTFTLRNDVLFHPSRQLDSISRRVNSADFLYSFNRILDDEVASPGLWIFDYVDKDSPFMAPDDSTFIVHLRQAFPAFLSILAMPYCSVVPEEVVEFEGTDFSIHPVGTGPFYCKYWSPEEKLILLRNDEYFEKDYEGVSLPYLDAIAISFIKDKQSEFLEFLKGNLDFLSGVHPAYKDELLTRSGSLNPKYKERFRLLKVPYLNTEYLGVLQDTSGLEVNPLLEKNLRMAVNYGFDREKMMKYLRNNLGFPADRGMIPPGLPGALNKGKGYRYDPDLAREYLEKTAYFRDGSQQKIVLTTTSDYLDLCEFIQFELSKLGVDIEITVSTGGSFRNMVANGNLPFFRASWIADYVDAENYLALFYSGNFAPSGPNTTRFSKPEYDHLYEKSFLETDPVERFALYSLMDSIIISEAPVIPLFYDMVVRFTTTEIEGFAPNPMNNLVLKNLRKRKTEN